MNPDIIVGGVGKTGRLPLMIIGETSSDCSWAGLGLLYCAVASCRYENIITEDNVHQA